MIEKFDLGIPSIISEMTRNIDFMFYLTGSRYFGGALRNSDWDFFVEYSHDLMDWLREKGFYPIGKESDYRDHSLMSVYELSDGTHTTQIQVVINAENRLECRTYLANTFKDQMSVFRKDIRSSLWDMAMEMVAANKNCN